MTLRLSDAILQPNLFESRALLGIPCLLHASDFSAEVLTLPRKASACRDYTPRC
jgi:hypothetical protein